MSARGTSNTNSRGNTTQRRGRRTWLLATWAGWDNWGDVFCVFCGARLTNDTVTVDRIIPGILGGSYRRGNIRPACITCNSIEGSRLRDLLRDGLNFFSRSFPDTGISHPRLRGRITHGQTVSIRYLLGDGRLSQARIARETGVSVETVRRIQKLMKQHEGAR